MFIPLFLKSSLKANPPEVIFLVFLKEYLTQSWLTLDCCSGIFPSVSLTGITGLLEEPPSLISRKLLENKNRPIVDKIDVQGIGVLLLESSHYFYVSGGSNRIALSLCCLCMHVCLLPLTYLIHLTSKGQLKKICAQAFSFNH